MHSRSDQEIFCKVIIILMRWPRWFQPYDPQHLKTFNPRTKKGQSKHEARESRHRDRHTQEFQRSSSSGSQSWRCLILEAKRSWLGPMCEERDVEQWSAGLNSSGILPTWGVVLTLLSSDYPAFPHPHVKKCLLCLLIQAIRFVSLNTTRPGRYCL